MPIKELETFHDVHLEAERRAAQHKDVDHMEPLERELTEAKMVIGVIWEQFELTRDRLRCIEKGYVKV